MRVCGREDHEEVQVVGSFQDACAEEASPRHIFPVVSWTSIRCDVVLHAQVWRCLIQARGLDGVLRHGDEAERSRWRHLHQLHLLGPRRDPRSNRGLSADQ